jgi:hypothetical protein
LCLTLAMVLAVGSKARWLAVFETDAVIETAQDSTKRSTSGRTCKEFECW